MKYIILISIPIFGLYVICENFYTLVVRREKLGSGVRIVHLSDLHKRTFGKNNCRLFRKIRAEKPDIIIFSGDLVSRSETDFSKADTVLKELCSIAPVYMIYGNHEQSVYEENVEKFESMLSRNSQTVLKNDHADVKIDDRELKIFGLLDNYDIYKKNGRYRDLDKITVDDLEKRLGHCPDGEVLLIAHNPFFGEAYAKWGAKYTFSGHVHGGTIRIFGIALLSPERKFFPKNSKGVYSIGGMKLLVSAGLGKFRMFDPAEIVVYEI